MWSSLVSDFLSQIEIPDIQLQWDYYSPDELALAANHGLTFLNVGQSRFDELEDVEFMSNVFRTLLKITHCPWNDETDRRWNQVEESRCRQLEDD